MGFEFLLGNARNDAAAGAVAAVGCTAVGNEEENTIGVAVYEPWDGHVGVLATGVGHFSGIGEGFFDTGDDLATDWAVGVVFIDKIEKMRRDGHGQLVAGEEDAGAFFFREFQAFFDRA